MSEQPTSIWRGSLDDAYDTVTRDANPHPVDKPRGLLHAVTMATKTNGDARIAINLSTVLATIFGVIVLAVAGRVFLNAVALTEVKILIQTSSAAQSEFRSKADARFTALENKISNFQEANNKLIYRMQRIEDHHEALGGNDDFEKTK